MREGSDHANGYDLVNEELVVEPDPGPKAPGPAERPEHDDQDDDGGR